MKLRHPAIDSFIRSLKGKGVQVEVLDKDKIEKALGQKLVPILDRLEIFLVELDFPEVVIVLRQEREMVWYSEMRGRLAINLVLFDIYNPRHQEKARKEAETAKEIETIDLEVV